MPNLPAMVALAAMTQPAIEAVYPAGGRAGHEVRVHVKGHGFVPGCRLLAPSLGIAAGIPVSLAATKDASFGLSFEMPIAAACQPGMHLVWINGPSGVSRPFPFLVDILPELVEIDSGTGSATLTEIPCVINGLVYSTAIDTYRFFGHAGQRIGVDVWADRLGSLLDPRFVIEGPNGRAVDEVDDTAGLGADCRSVVTVPTDGEYSLSIHDSTFQLNRPHPYRIRLGGQFGDEVFPPGGTAGSTLLVRVSGGSLMSPITLHQPLYESPLARKSVVVQGESVAGVVGGDIQELIGSAELQMREHPLTAPAMINGRLANAAGDRYRIAVRPGMKLWISVDAESIESPMDPVVQVFAPGGQRIAELDDTFRSTGVDRDKKPIGYRLRDPRGFVAAPSDAREVAIAIMDRNGRSGLGYTYRLAVESASDRFELVPKRGEVVVPEAGIGLFEFDIRREDYGGALEIAAEGLPNGWTARPMYFARGIKTGYLAVERSANAAAEVVLFRTICRAIDRTHGMPQRIIRYELALNETTPQREVAPRSVVVEQFLACRGTEIPIRIAMETVEPVILKRGSDVTLPLRVERQPGAMTANLAFTALGLPAGVTASFRQSASAESGTAITVHCDKAAAHIGRFSLIVQARKSGVVSGAPATARPVVVEFAE